MPGASAGLASAADDLALIADAVREAGALGLRYFRNAPKTWAKQNDSPVTEADLALEAFLRGRLLAARPGYGWLSEEAEDDGSRLLAARTFIVDPIDGTREFIAGGPTWTVPVAVVEGGRPVAGVVYAPALDHLYAATLGGGASRNGEPIRVSGRTGLDGSSLAGPRRLFRPPLIPPEVSVGVRFYSSLAYRLALVAEGRLDGSAVKAFAHDWDVAAADLLVHEAGGLVTGVNGAVLRYDRADTRHPPIIAATPGLIAPLTALVEAAIAAFAAEGGAIEGNRERAGG